MPTPPHRTSRVLASSALVVGLLLTAAGCGDDDPKAAPSDQTTAIERRVDDVKLETENGSGNVDATVGEAPEGWPEDVPLDGLRILSGGSDPSGESGTRMMVAAASSASAEDAATSFAQSMEGWTEVSNSTLPGDPPTIMLGYELDGRRVGVTIASKGSETTVLVNHTPAD